MSDADVANVIVVVLLLSVNSLLALLIALIASRRWQKKKRIKTELPLGDFPWMVLRTTGNIVRLSRSPQRQSRMVPCRSSLFTPGVLHNRPPQMGVSDADYLVFQRRSMGGCLQLYEEA